MAHSISSRTMDEAEIKRLHGEDRKAARIIVLLLFGIFFIGVILYSIVWIAVAS